MAEITSKILTYKDMVEMPYSMIRKLSAIRVFMKVVYKPVSIEVPEELNFVSHEFLEPVLFQHSFQDQLAAITERVYHNSDMLYGFSNFDPEFEFSFQLIKK